MSRFTQGITTADVRDAKSALKSCVRAIYVSCTHADSGCKLGQLQTKQHLFKAHPEVVIGAPQQLNELVLEHLMQPIASCL